MKNSIKIVLGIAGFAFLLAAAVLAYNALSDRVNPDNDFGLTPDPGVSLGDLPGDSPGDVPSDPPSVSPGDLSSDSPSADDVPSDSPGETETREKASDFSMTDKNGNSVRLSDMAGKAIVLNFWASWCPPCRSEMPDFETAYRELGEEVQFMMVNLTDGQRETREYGENYVNGEGFTFPVFFDEEGEGASAYGIRAIPTTYFIDKDGYITTMAQGALNEQTLRQRIDMIK